MGWFRTLLVLGIVCQGLAPLGTAVAQVPDVVQVGRYTTQAARPTATAGEPLQVFAHISFPRSTVKTVGEALEHTLLRTGYRLQPEGMEPGAVSFLALPLPESQRQLGSYRVEDILKVLIGPTWALQIDHRTRRVWFAEQTGQQADTRAMELEQIEAAEEKARIQARADAEQRRRDASRDALYQ